MIYSKNQSDKETANLLWRNSRRELGQDLFRLRSQANITLNRLSQDTNLPVSIIDHLETGFGQFDLGSLLKLTRFYGKSIKISLIDATPPSLED